MELSLSHPLGGTLTFLLIVFLYSYNWCFFARWYPSRKHLFCDIPKLVGSEAEAVLVEVPSPSRSCWRPGTEPGWRPVAKTRAGTILSMRWKSLRITEAGLKSQLPSTSRFSELSIGAVDVAWNSSERNREAAYNQYNNKNNNVNKTWWTRRFFEFDIGWRGSRDND